MARWREEAKGLSYQGECGFAEAILPAVPPGDPRPVTAADLRDR